MEGSNSDGKKIVLKRRNRQGEDLDLLVDPAPQGESAQVESAEAEPNKYFFEGEIFDQFYRPMRLKGGVERLREIATIPLTTPEPSPRESAAKRETQAADRQAIAEALAHQIFKLAQKDRETALDVYLSAFNVALAERSCREMRDILARANEFFTEHYYAPIRERGERPEIYHQIVKRVGHANVERIAKVVFGIDVETTAGQLWELHHGAHADKAARIVDVLLDCTEFQVAALREEFLCLPYKDLARQLFGVLNHSSEEGAGPARKTIGKSGLDEHKRTNAFRAREQLRTLHYLLYGRSHEELLLVKRFYIDLGDQSLPDHELTIEAQVRRLFPPAEIDRLGRLLGGWSAHEEAEEVNKILFGQSGARHLVDHFSDPREAVDRDYIQGLGPLLRRFKKCRLLRTSDGVNARTFLAHQTLRENIAALSYQRFVATNQALQDYYGYELDSMLFSSLSPFDARQCALLLHERIATSFDLFEAMQPIEFLAPRHGLAVQKAYQCIFGITLKDSLGRRMRTIGARISPQEFEVLLSRYVDGHGCWPLNLDLLACYRDDEEPSAVWDHDFAHNATDVQQAMKLGELLDQEVSKGALDRQIKELIVGLSTEALHRLERVFYDLTDPHTPLAIALEEVMSRDAYEATMLLFVGIDVTDILQRLHDDPLSIISFRDLTAQHIGFIRERFKSVFFSELDEHMIKQTEQQGDKELILEAVGILLKPEVFAVRRTLGTLKRESAHEIDLIREVLSGSATRVMGFERGYDLVFPTLRVHLKLAAARGAITVGTFAEMVLLLEGIEPEILTSIQECFDSLNIELLQEILRKHKFAQRLLEECYNLLYPDREFRHALNDMAVDLDHINETLLHLEGFCSLSVAEEIGALIETLSGDVLATAVIEVLTPQSGDRVNERIPQDINWMDEMVYQIGLAYRRLFGDSLVTACRKKGVASAQLEDITGRLYGLEVCSSARDLFTLIKCSKEGAPSPEGAEARICGHLESRGPKYRERLMAAYQAFWAQQPGFSGLLDDMTKYFKDAGPKRKLLALFLSVSSDRKAASAAPPELH